MDGILLPNDASGPRYLGVGECAARYGMSGRHWLRLVESGRAPLPTRFGRLVRWSLASLESWEGNGCPSVRPAKGIPETLVAELVAALRVGDQDRARKAQRKLKSRFGMELSFGDEPQGRHGVQHDG